MRTQYYTASSLDGFIATPEHSLAWLFQFDQAPAGEQGYDAFIAQVGSLCMGASTYDWIVRELGIDQQPDRWPYPQPAWVFTHRPRTAPVGADVRFVSGDVAPVHATMRAAAGDGNIWLVGGGDLVGQFHDAGLLDEIIVSLASVTLGAGRPLLPRAIVSPPLRLRSAVAVGESFAVLTYEVTRATRPGDPGSGRSPDGDPQTGDH